MYLLGMACGHGAAGPLQLNQTPGSSPLTKFSSPLRLPDQPIVTTPISFGVFIVSTPTAPIPSADPDLFGTGLLEWVSVARDKLLPSPKQSCSVPMVKKHGLAQF